MSLKTHEIIVVSARSHNGDMVSPYPDPAPAEKGVMRSFRLDLDATEHTGDTKRFIYKDGGTEHLNEDDLVLVVMEGKKVYFIPERRGHKTQLKSTRNWE